MKYQDTTFDGRVFGARSMYKGASSPELDAAWDRISQVKPFALSEDGVRKFRRKKEDIVKAGDEGYLANLEVYHQLHCLVSRVLIVPYSEKGVGSHVSSFASPQKGMLIRDCRTC